MTKPLLSGVLLAALTLVPSVRVLSQLSAPGDAGLPKTPIHGGSVKLPLRLYQGYLVVVEGSIGRLTHLNFLIDTGAYPSVVDEKIVDDLGLEQKVAKVRVSNQSLPAGLAVLPSLQLGPIHVERLPVLIQDLSFLEKILGCKVDAIVGMDVLGKTSFSIGYKKKQMLFGPIEHVRFSVPFETAPPYVTIRMELHNCAVRLLVDTGDPALMFFQSRLRNAMDLQTMGLDTGTNLGGQFRRKKVRVSELTLGKEKFGGQVAFVVDDEEDSGRDFDGVLGTRGLQFEEVAFDFERQRFSWKW